MRTSRLSPPHLLFVKKSYFRLGKTITDMFFGFLGSLCLVLALPIFAAGIYFSSPGPIFFKQRRIGQYGKEFVCLKFRSMHANNRGSGAGYQATQKADPRIFPFGQFLRKTNLDELPQVFNVFLGQMSIVGPRPYPVTEYWYWAGLLPGFSTRNLVKPGLTGLAQARGYRGGTSDIEHMRARFEQDLEYIRGYSLKLDLYIIWLTFKSMVLGRTNAH